MQGRYTKYHNWSVNVLMRPLHIRLDLMKQFVKAPIQALKALQYLKNVFPKLSETQIKAGILIWPQFKKVMTTDGFPQLLNTGEKQAWTSLKTVIHAFLENHRSDN